jgi:hypothetical protein
MKPTGAFRARLRIRTQPTSGEFPRLGDTRTFRLVVADGLEGARVAIMPDQVVVAGDGSVVGMVAGKPVLRLQNLAQLLALLGLEELELEEV